MTKSAVIVKWQSVLSLPVIASRFHKNGVAIQKLGLNFALNSKRKLKKAKCFEFWSQILQKGAVKPLHAPPFIGTLFIEIWI